MSGRFPTRRAALGMAAAALAVPAGARAAAFGAGGRLQVAVYKDFAPWSFRKDGQVTGIDVELAAAIAKRLDMRADPFELIADEDVGADLRNTLWRGNLIGSPLSDFMMHVPTEKAFAEDQPKVAIGGAYFRESFRLACADAETCRRGPPALRGQSLGVELASAPDLFLLSTEGGSLRSAVHHFPQGADAAQALARGEVQDVLATRAQIDFGLGAKRPGAADGASVYDGPFIGLGKPSWEVGLAVRKENAEHLPDLIKAKDAVVASGEFAAICARYGVKVSSPAAA